MAPVTLVFSLAHVVGEVAPAAGTKLFARLSEHEVAPGKSVNFPAGHTAQPPFALVKLPAAHGSKAALHPSLHAPGAG
jgi:hypothetical protein